MRISTRLRLNAWLAAAAALLALFLMVWSYRNMAKSDQDENLVREMSRLLSERRVLREDYLYRHEERARLQWLVHSDRIGRLLAQVGKRLVAPEEKALLTEAEKELAATNLIFARIVEARANWGATRHTPPPGEEHRIDKLKTRTFLLNDNLARLEELIDEGSRRARNRTVLFLLLFIVTGVGVMVGNSLFLNRMLARRLAGLQEGAALIGSGNLDHRLAVGGDDELSDMARTTNDMAANLQKAFTSMANLEAEIASRREVEQALLKLSIAVEQSPVSIIITDTSGAIEFVNPRFTQLTGYEKTEVLGKNPRILKSGETPPELYRHLWSTISSGRVWQGAFHNLKKNGEPFLEYATIAPVKNPQGVITNYIAIKEDVTERRSLENQLRQSQKMEAIGTLAGRVAHDFNNILTAIIGFGSLLEMKMAPDDPLHHNVAQILSAAERAANLTRSLLAFSRKQQIATRVMNLNEIVTGLEKMLNRLIREDIELSIAIAERSLPVLVDAGQIEQVLINLVTNARDAMPEGGTLSITTCAATIDDEFGKIHGYGEPGDYAILVVADSGTGMEESVRQRIFDPFFSTKEVGKGTGLGLSVCYGIIKQHGGYINCYSEPGSGTTFRIYLPLVHGNTEQAVAGTIVPLEGGTETILLAEDEATVRELTSKILREFGYTVIEACDGAEAVTRFREDGARIDLCLFDVIMPQKKGWEALAEIRGIRPEVKALFMSGYQPDFDRLQDMTQSDAGFIAKPVVPRDLLRKIREILDS